MADDRPGWSAVLPSFLFGALIIFGPLLIIVALIIFSNDGSNIYDFFVNLSFPGGIILGVAMSAWVWHFRKNKTERLIRRSLK